MTDQQYREAARLNYQREGEIEIDDNAVISRGSDPGAYVEAWVWVEDPSVEASEDDPDQEKDPPIPRAILRRLAEVEGTFSVHNGIATLENGETILLTSYLPGVS